MDSKPGRAYHLALAYCFISNGRHGVLTPVTGNLCSLESYILHNDTPDSHYQPWILFIETLDTLSKLSPGTHNSPGKMRRHPGGGERCTNLKHAPHGSCHLTACSDSRNRQRCCLPPAPHCPLPHQKWIEQAQLWKAENHHAQPHSDQYSTYRLLKVWGPGSSSENEWNQMLKRTSHQ